MSVISRPGRLVCSPSHPSPAPVPAGRSARSRSATVLAVIAAVVLLGSCTGQQRTPSSYGDTTAKNFQKGCVETSTKGGVDNPSDYCKCSYDAVVKAIPFDQFKEVYSDLSDDPGPLPDQFAAIVARCAEETNGGTGSSTPSESTPTTAG